MSTRLVSWRVVRSDSCTLHTCTCMRGQAETQPCIIPLHSPGLRKVQKWESSSIKLTVGAALFSLPTLLHFLRPSKVLELAFSLATQVFSLRRLLGRHKKGTIGLSKCGLHHTPHYHY